MNTVKYAYEEDEEIVVIFKSYIDDKVNIIIADQGKGVGLASLKEGTFGIIMVKHFINSIKGTMEITNIDGLHYHIRFDHHGHQWTIG